MDFEKIDLEACRIRKFLGEVKEFLSETDVELGKEKPICKRDNLIDITEILTARAEKGGKRIEGKVVEDCKTVL